LQKPDCNRNFIQCLKGCPFVNCYFELSILLTWNHRMIFGSAIAKSSEKWLNQVEFRRKFTSELFRSGFGG